MKDLRDYSVTWYHREDTRKDPGRVLSVWWVCPECWTQANPAVISGMEPVVSGPWDRDDGWEPAQDQKPEAWLSAFPCRRCGTVWDVTMERRRP